MGVARSSGGRCQAAADPDTIVTLDVVEEARERRDATWAAHETHVQADRHHPRVLGALGVEHVERVSHVGEPLVARAEALWRSKLHVVVVERVGHHQVRAAGLDDPVRQVIVVGVGVVEEAALLDDQPPRVGAQAAGVPAEGPASGRACDALDRAPHVLALDVFRDELVVDPAPPVAHHLVPRLDDGGGRFRMALERHRDGEDADPDTALGEQAHQPPEADAAAVLVDRLDLKVPHVA